MDQEMNKEELAEEVKEEPKRDSKTKIHYIIFSGIIIILLATIILLVWKMNKDKNDKTQKKEMAPVAEEQLSDEEKAAQEEAKRQEEIRKKVEENKKLGHHVNDYGYGSWTVYCRRAEDSINLQYYYVDETGAEKVLRIDEVNKLLNEQVATCGDDVLTNRMLQHYYEETRYNFSSYYQDYLVSFMDTSLPLDGQLEGVFNDGSYTWQHFFLEDALTTYQMTTAYVKEAQANGFTLTEEQQKQLDTAMDLDAQAVTYGAADGQTLVKELLGPYATVESYQQYVERTLLANFYMETLTAEMEATDEEADAYYEENIDLFVEKYAKGNVDVRHILIAPEAAEDGTISDEAWAKAEAEANRILAEYTAGEQTEDVFAALATTYTTDPGSQQTGGLYESVYPGQMVPAFDTWCFDEARVTGDTGIVKTDYGYHIMYFVGESDLWRDAAKKELLVQKIAKMQEELVKKYELTTDLPKVILIEQQ